MNRMQPARTPLFRMTHALRNTIMTKFIQFTAAIVGLTLAGSSAQAADSQPQQSAQWPNDFSNGYFNGYSGYNTFNGAGMCGPRCRTRSYGMPTYNSWGGSGLGNSFGGYGNSNMYLDQGSIYSQPGFGLPSNGGLNSGGFNGGLNGQLGPATLPNTFAPGQYSPNQYGPGSIPPAPYIPNQYGPSLNQGFPGQSLGQPYSGYNQPGSSYTAPMAGYGASTFPGMSQPLSGFGQPAGFGQPFNSYSQPASRPFYP